MRLRLGAHADLAHLLGAIKTRHASVDQHLSPAAVDVNHELGDQLVQRRPSWPRHDRHPAVGRGVPVDQEVVIHARDVRLATALLQSLGEPPQRAQLVAPFRIRH